MLRIPIVSEKKQPTPDWPIMPHIPRSAEEYERYNQRKPEDKTMAGEQKYKIADELQARNVGAMVSRLSPAAGPWEVTVRKWSKKRTNPQNALYWQWLTIICADTGYTKDDLHDALREKFLPWEDVLVAGITRRKLTSTASADFKTTDMAVYMTSIDQWAQSELGIILPHPEDAHYESLAR